MVGQMMEVDLETETGRYEARDAIAALLARWCAGKTLAEIRGGFAGSGVLWGPFQDFVELVRDDPRCSPQNPLFADIDQPGIGRYPMPGLPLDFSATRASRPGRRPASASTRPGASATCSGSCRTPASPRCWWRGCSGPSPCTHPARTPWSSEPPPSVRRSSAP